MNCDYCNERQGIETVYNKIYGALNRIVYETRSFLVFPCMGQLREGHLLIVSKTHINAVGMLPLDDIDELNALIEDIALFFQNVYQKDLLCFEHGVLNDRGENGGCGIYHMHLHLIPANKNEFLKVLEYVCNDKTNIVSLSDSFQKTYNCVANAETYVYFSFYDNTKESSSFVVTNSKNYFESQYMRKIVGKVFGRTEWDWRKIKCREEELINTLEKGRLFFKNAPISV